MPPTNVSRILPQAAQGPKPSTALYRTQVLLASRRPLYISPVANAPCLSPMRCSRAKLRWARSSSTSPLELARLGQTHYRSLPALHVRHFVEARSFWHQVEPESSRLTSHSGGMQETHKVEKNTDSESYTLESVRQPTILWNIPCPQHLIGGCTKLVHGVDPEVQDRKRSGCAVVSANCLVQLHVCESKEAFRPNTTWGYLSCLRDACKGESANTHDEGAAADRT